MEVLNNVSFQQAFVRILRVNGNRPPAGGLMYLNAGPNQVFTVSVCPAKNLAWQVVKISDGQASAFTYVNNSNPVCVFSVPSNNFVGMGTEYLMRVITTKLDGNNNPVPDDQCCEIEVQSSGI